MNVTKERRLEIENSYRSYAPVIFVRCSRILKSRDEAWDATQEVFVLLMKHYDSIQDKKYLLAWLITTTTRYCISLLRKKSFVEFDEEIFRPEIENSGESRLFSRLVMKKILGSWDRKTVEIVLYTYIDRYTQAEIASFMGIGESTVRKYLTRFRKNVKKWKQTYGKDE